MRLSDGVEHVYTFSDEAGAPGLDRGDSFSSTGAGSVGYERETRDREGERERMLLFGERAELPTGVVTIMTGCYSPSCSAEDWEGCYAHGCPRKVSSRFFFNLFRMMLMECVGKLCETYLGG